MPNVRNAADLKQLFSGINKAQDQFSSGWEKGGHYLMRIDKVKIIENREGQLKYMIEKTVLHVFDDEAGKGHRVGTEVVHSVGNHMRSDFFKKEIKALLVNLFDISPDVQKADEKAFEDFCENTPIQMQADNQPMSGMVVEMKNVTRNQKNDPTKDFTYVNYKRQVPWKEVASTLTEGEIKLFYPDGALDKKIAAEAV